jgi:pimeloyl-ACP methyl ester carboxylesterase
MRRVVAVKTGATNRASWRAPSLLALVLVFLSACATPIGVARLNTQQAQQLLTANALSSDAPSSWSSQVLQRNGLFVRFKDDPGGTLAELHEMLKQPVDEERFQDRLFALAELSFLHAERSGVREYYLAAAVSAYAFLLPETGEIPRPLDPRFRLAADLYNRGLARGLASADGAEVVLKPGAVKLPFGELTLTVETSGLLWGGYRLKRFIPVGEFEVRGLRNRYRQAGAGAPLAAEVEALENNPNAEIAAKRIPPRIKVPVTAFVRIEEPRRSVVAGKLAGRLELYAADQTYTVNIEGRDVPLELEPTAALAYGLEGAPVWDFELAGFRVADRHGILGDGLLMIHPYRPGRIPVIFVHGTASSPARWAEMYNELSNDPVLRGRYQFWLFQYNTGQPILYSAMLLRRALGAIVSEVDPAGQDEALKRMVMIGHSQGGLLTKLMAVHSGDRFWRNASDQPFENVKMDSETRSLLREGMFFDPVPTLKRVIFVSTPHRGSYQARGWLLPVIRRLVTLPGTLVSQFAALTKAGELGALKTSQVPTSVENMSPGHPFLKALNDLPIDPSIPAHSIIAVLGEGPVSGKTDGVVAYESAHIEGVESEKIVRSGHSTQGEPQTIEEVRRILREHLGSK